MIELSHKIFLLRLFQPLVKQKKIGRFLNFVEGYHDDPAGIQWVNRMCVWSVTEGA